VLSGRVSTADGCCLSLAVSRGRIDDWWPSFGFACLRLHGLVRLLFSRSCILQVFEGFFPDARWRLMSEFGGVASGFCWGFSLVLFFSSEF
jgi:hypothetical protein